jgi:hypothetical protein
VLLLSSESSVVDEERTGKVRDERRQGKGRMKKIERKRVQRIG